MFPTQSDLFFFPNDYSTVFEAFLKFFRTVISCIPTDRHAKIHLILQVFRESYEVGFLAGERLKLIG